MVNVVLREGFVHVRLGHCAACRLMELFHLPAGSGLPFFEFFARFLENATGGVQPGWAYGWDRLLEYCRRRRSPCWSGAWRTTSPCPGRPGIAVHFRSWEGPQFHGDCPFGYRLPVWLKELQEGAALLVGFPFSGAELAAKTGPLGLMATAGFQRCWVQHPRVNAGISHATSRPAGSSFFVARLPSR